MNTSYFVCFCLTAKTGGGRSIYSTPYAPISPSARASCSARISFTVNRSSLRGMSAGVQQINNAVQEVNDLARKNKDSIEGLASEVRKFKV